MRMQTDWIVLESATGDAVCKRCGGRDTPELPMAVTAYVAWTKAFQDKHKDCKLEDV